MLGIAPVLERLNFLPRDATNRREECPLVRKWHKVVIHKNAVADLTRLTLKRQGNQIAESTLRQGVLARDNPVIGREPNFGMFLQCHRQQIGQRRTNSTSGDIRVQKEPEMRPLARPRTLKRNWKSNLSDGLDDHRYIPAPRTFIEVQRRKTHGLVFLHRIRAHHERLAVRVTSSQMRPHNLIRDRRELAIPALTAFHMRQSADAAFPLVRALRGIAASSALGVLEPPRIDILPTEEQLAEERDLLLIGRTVVDAFSHDSGRSTAILAFP